jgi:hypothetical protein
MSWAPARVGLLSVADFAAPVGRFRAAGGHADEPERKPYGLLAECVDDQGGTFRFWQPVDCRVTRRSKHIAPRSSLISNAARAVKLDPLRKTRRAGTGRTCGGHRT